MAGERRAWGRPITFIIGENAGQGGTTGIPGNDFAEHIADFVMQQPDAG